MTDRLNSLLVVLEHDIRDDDAEPILEAIRQLRGVLTVTGNVRNYSDHIAEERAKADIHRKLFAVIYPKGKS